MRGTRWFSVVSLWFIGVFASGVLAASCSSKSNPGERSEGGSSSGSSGDSSGGGSEAGEEAGCAQFADDANLTSPTVSFSKDVLPLFQSTCGLSNSCHATPLALGDVAGPTMSVFLGCGPFLIANGDCSATGDQAAQVYAGLVGASASQPTEESCMPFVAPGKPTKSYLMHKMDGDQGCTVNCCIPNNAAVTQTEGSEGAGETITGTGWCGTSMPWQVAILPAGPVCGGSTNCYMAEARDTVRAWIAQGALKCLLGETQCNGQQPQRCGSNATWQNNGGPCTAQTCVQGACAGVCAPGQQECNGNNVWTCSGSGAYAESTTCAQTCEPSGTTASCTGCTSDAQCSGATPSCNTTTATCVCVPGFGLGPGSCSTPTAHCSASGTCVECLSNTNCTGAAAECVNGSCVQSSAVDGGEDASEGDGGDDSGSSGVCVSAAACGSESCVSAADCVSGQICCIQSCCGVMPQYVGSCQAAPCPLTALGPLQACATAAECAAGDVCTPNATLAARGLDGIRTCNSP
jgi:hypothetical protein